MYVVDASLVRRYDDNSQEGALAMELLDKILDDGHEIAVSVSMTHEYTEHMGYGATLWYESMTLRGLVHRRDEECEAFEETLHSKLSQKIIHNQHREKEIRKDIRLLATALAFKCPVLSLDNAMRSYASQGELTNLVGEVYWLNPLEFLPDDTEFGLGDYSFPDSCKLSHVVLTKMFVCKERERKKAVAKKSRRSRLRI